MELPTNETDYCFIGAMILAAMEEEFRHFFGEQENARDEFIQLIGGDIFGDMYTNAAFHGNKNDLRKKYTWACGMDRKEFF